MTAAFKNSLIWGSCDGSQCFFYCCFLSDVIFYSPKSGLNLPSHSYSKTDGKLDGITVWAGGSKSDLKIVVTVHNTNPHHGTEHEGRITALWGCGEGKAWAGQGLAVPPRPSHSFPVHTARL